MIDISSKKTTIIYSLGIAICFLPIITPSMALAIGILLSAFGLTHQVFTKHSSLALKISIVLMGFGMNLPQVIMVSKTGFVDTAISVFSVMILGFLLTKLLKVDSKIGILISSGTAICGGSAIAAIAPVIGSKNSQTSFALVVIFVLNALALFIFPVIGHYSEMSQVEFGIWAAIAIHDTSSVVGAAAIFGEEALQVATTIKMIRALWIVPLSLFIAVVQRNASKSNVRVPWFIAVFVLAILITYFIPSALSFFNYLDWLGRKGMVVALFLIGSGISFSEAKKAGWRSFLMGILLWLAISIVSFLIIINS